MLSRQIRVAGVLSFGVAMLAAPLAAQKIGPFAIGVKASTLGPGVEAAARIAGPLVLRGNIAFYTYSRTEDVFENPAEIKAKLSSKSIIADIHPMSGTLRLSIGMVFSPPEVTAVATNSGDIEFNDHQYTGAQVSGATLTVHGKKSAPYFGIGFDKSVFAKGHLAFGFELGVVSWGRPSIDIVPVTTLTGNAKAQLDADINAEVESKRADIEDKVPGKAKLFPVIGFSLKYRM